MIQYTSALLAALQLRAHERHQKIIVALSAVELPDDVFVVIEGRQAELLCIERDHLFVQFVHRAATPHFSS